MRREFERSGDRVPCSDDTLEYEDMLMKTLRSYFNRLKINEAACKQAVSFQRVLTNMTAQIISGLCSNFFNNLCLCHHSIKSESLWVACASRRERSLHLLGQRGEGGRAAVLLSHRSENVSRLCSLLPFALRWNLVFSACLAMWSSYKRRGRGRLAARICTSARAGVHACGRACLLVCVGGAG